MSSLSHISCCHYCSDPIVLFVIVIILLQHQSDRCHSSWHVSDRLLNWFCAWYCLVRTVTNLLADSYIDVSSVIREMQRQHAGPSSDSVMCILAWHRRTCTLAEVELLLACYPAEVNGWTLLQAFIVCTVCVSGLCWSCFSYCPVDVHEWLFNVSGMQQWKCTLLLGLNTLSHS